MDVAKEELVEEVLRLIVEDVEYGDLTSIEGLLMLVPENALIGFLPEDGEFFGRLMGEEPQS